MRHFCSKGPPGFDLPVGIPLRTVPLRSLGRSSEARPGLGKQKQNHANYYYYQYSVLRTFYCVPEANAN